MTNETNDTNEKLKEIVKFLEKTIDTQETTVTVIERKAVLLATFCTTVMGYILVYDAGLRDAYAGVFKHILNQGPWSAGDALSMLASDHQRILTITLHGVITLKMLAISCLACGVLLSWMTLITGRYQFKGIVWDEPSNKIPGNFAALLESAEKYYKQAIATNDIAMGKKTNRIKMGLSLGLLGAEFSFLAILMENGVSLLVAAG